MYTHLASYDVCETERLLVLDARKCRIVDAVDAEDWPRRLQNWQASAVPHDLLDARQLVGVAGPVRR